MSPTVPERAAWLLDASWEQFVALDPERYPRAEYQDGEVYVPPAAERRHDTCARRIANDLEAQLTPPAVVHTTRTGWSGLV